MNTVLCEEYNLFVSLLLSNPLPTPNNTPAFLFKVLVTKQQSNKQQCSTKHADAQWRHP